MEGACHSSVQPLPQQQQHGTKDAVDITKQHELQEAADIKAAEAAAAQQDLQKQWQQGAALTVDTCLFADVLRSEGLPQLLTAFCCQHNMSFLQTFRDQAVAAELKACIGQGDGCCRIVVTPVDHS